MADTVYGADLACLEDLDFELTPVVNHRYGCALAIARRWLTVRGTLWYAPDYGYDVRQYLGAASVTSVGFIEAALEAEALKDERVAACEVRVTRENRTLRIEALLTSVEGPVPLTLVVSELGVAQLNA
jgi:hypothetical protein